MFGLSRDLVEKIEKRTSLFVKILKRNLSLGKEPVLIISDYGEKHKQLASMLAFGYYHAAKRKGNSVEILFQEEKKTFMAVDPHILKALQLLPIKSVVILAVSNKLGKIGEEKSFRAFCKERGHRFLSATGLGNVSQDHFDLFLETMSVNKKRLQKIALNIKKKWDKAQEIRVKTDTGTDLTFDVTGMEAIANIGEYHQAGKGGNMPAGEVYIPPKGLTGVNGVLIIDGSIRTEEGSFLVEEPLTVYIKNGAVTKMEGKHAPLLEKTFEKFENRAKHPERIRLVSELSIGLNPAAVLIGSMIMDEKALGTAHIAFGNNYWFGGEIKTIHHSDQVFKNPTFYIDGKKMEM